MANLTGFKRDNKGIFIEKDPTANIVYGLDFSDYIESGDAVATSVVTIETITGDASPLAFPTSAGADVNISGNLVSIRVTNGTSGNVYNLGVKITTNNGNVDSRHFRIVVQDRQL